jgi:hypothetical protein
MQMLGYGGLVPFFALSLISVFSSAGEIQQIAQNGLLFYTVAIISFVGAVSWGLALAMHELSALQRIRLLLWSVVPSLLAVAAALLSGRFAVFGLMAVLSLAYWMDRLHGQQMGFPQAWIRLRLQLTLGVLIALAIGLLA